MTEVRAALEPCPFGCDENIEMWNGLGTQADVSCLGCGCSRNIQVTDVLDYETRYAPENAFSYETLSYPAHIVEKVKLLLVEQWNTRALPKADTADAEEPWPCSGNHVICQCDECLCKATPPREQAGGFDVDEALTAWSDLHDFVFDADKFHTIDNAWLREKINQAKLDLQTVRKGMIGVRGGG